MTKNKQKKKNSISPAFLLLFAPSSSVILMKGSHQSDGYPPVEYVLQSTINEQGLHTNCVHYKKKEKMLLKYSLQMNPVQIDM